MGKNRAAPGKTAHPNVKQAPKLTKDAAGKFLKQRQDKKLKGLKLLEKADAMEDAGEVAVATAPPPLDIESLRMQASQRSEEFASMMANQGVPDDVVEDEFQGNAELEAENTRKQFYTMVRKVIASAEVVIEVLDARDPEACRSHELEKEVAKAGKRLVLLLNKIDLVPKPVVEAWTKHFKRSFAVLTFKASHGGARRIIHAQTSAANAPDGLLQSTHAVVGADELMQLLKNYARVKGTKNKAHVTVGIVGYPNTGKSSIINSMKRHCAVETGGRAGVTKQIAEIVLDGKVTLLDSPGIIFEGASDDPSVVLRNVVRVEHVSDPIRVVEALVKKAPRDSLLRFYGMDRDFPSVDAFLIKIAQVRGKLKRGSGLDLESAARSVISDWTTGKFRYYALPPAESDAAAESAAVETVSVVNTLSQALDIDALLNGQGALPQVLGAPEERDDGEDVAMGADDVDM